MARLAALVDASRDVARSSGRLEKIGRLADLIRSLPAEEIEIAIAFLSGSPRQGSIGVGHAALSATAAVTPVEAPALTLAEVDEVFGELCAIAGKGAATARARALTHLFARASSEEQHFLRRLLYGELRQGALEGVLVDAVARAAAIPPARIRRAAMMAGSLGHVARIALSQGDAALDAFSIQLLRPVQPMLAESADSVDEALDELGDASLEYKIDGARIQVHKAGGDVRMYSRTLRDVTAAAPEVVALVTALPPKELVLDGEVVALRSDGAPHPFQVTMSRFSTQRGRDARRGKADGPEQLALTPFFFDCLYVDGASLIDEPLERRLTALRDVAPALTVPLIVRPTFEQAQAFTRETLARGHEGVMAKSLAAPYAAGRRGAAWRKIKQARTLDLVILAAEWGHGRRQGWLSNLHLGARDPAANGFVMLGKTFKGLTDRMLTWQTERLLQLEIGRDGYTVFVRPELVVEIAFNEIQESPVYPGGLALRFARVKRYRTDKTAVEADTIDQVRALAMPSGTAEDS
jgi:DNA ligase-1